MGLCQVTKIERDRTTMTVSGELTEAQTPTHGLTSTPHAMKPWVVWLQMRCQKYSKPAMEVAGASGDKWEGGRTEDMSTSLEHVPQHPDPPAPIALLVCVKL